MLQLRWDHEFQFAGYYAALWQGFYEEEGLQVEIRSRIASDGSFRDIFEEVELGRADFSIGGADILVHNDRGADYVVLATILHESPNAFYALSRETLHEPADFLRHPVALLDNDYDSLELFAMLVAEGLDPDQVDRRPFQPGLEPLLRGDFAITPSYRMSAEWRARELGIDLARLVASDFGAAFYGDTLFTTRAFVESHPDMADRFVRASLRGWAYALEHERDIAERITAELPRHIPYENLLGYNLFSAEVVRSLTGYPLVELGHTSPARWQRMHQLLADAGFVDGEFDAARLIFDPAAERAARLRTWILIILVPGAAGLALAGAGFAGITILRRKVAAATRALQAERRTLQLILDTAPVAIFWKDREHRYQGYNRQARAIAGIDRTRTVIGKTDHDLFTETVAREFQASDAAIMAGGKPEHDVLLTYIRPDGEIRYIKRRKVPLHSDSGSVEGVLACVEDVTEFLTAERQIRENFSLLRTVFDTIPDAIFVKDEHSRIVMANEQMAARCGLTTESIIGKATEELLPPSAAAAMIEIDREVMRTGVIRTSEEEELVCGGAPLTCQTVKAPYRDADGRVKGIVVMARDITGRLKELQTLREANRQAAIFRRMVESATQGIGTADLNGNVDYQNPALLRMLGLSSLEEAREYTYRDFYSEQDLAFLESVAIPKVHEQGSWVGELAVRTLNGGVTPTIQNIYLLRDDEGKPLALCNVVTDITDRVEAERRIRESEMRYRTLFELSHDPVLVVDPETTLPLEFSERLCSFLGYTAKEVATLPVAAYEAVESPNAVRAHIDRVVREGGDQFETRMRRKDGSVREVIVIARTIQLGNKTVCHSLYRDVTEQRQAEAALRSVNQELERRVEEMVARNREKDHLIIQQSRLAAMGEMIGHIAHQWRQPINALGLLLANLRDAYDYGELDTAYLDAQLQKGRQLIQRMSATIDDFRSFFSQGRENEPFRIVDAVRDAVSVMEASLVYHGIDVAIEADETLFAEGFRREFSQVILNILANAKDAIQNRTGEKGKVTVRISCQDHENCMGKIEIADNGEGVPVDILPRIFDPYFTTRPKGLGIGLHMARIIVEQKMGGRIDAYNAGQGAEISIILPLSAEIPGLSPRPATIEESPTHGNASTEK
ncbi:MAG: PAS domain S-box protein [Alphaproteobacteria bacterium]|nr:PAS domain S-box protein [Alphaproteobacteria bacterium]